MPDRHPDVQLLSLIIKRDGLVNTDLDLDLSFDLPRLLPKTGTWPIPSGHRTDLDLDFDFDIEVEEGLVIG